MAQALARLTERKIFFIIAPHIRFEGLPGEQATFFMLDPSGNALEFTPRFTKRARFWVDAVMDESLRELYQEVILDHSRHPRHLGQLADANHVGEGHNPLCGDRVKVYLQVGDGNKIDDISFEGKGCAISQASASMMTDLVKGRTVAEAEKLMGGFLHLVKGEDEVLSAPTTASIWT